MLCLFLADNRAILIARCIEKVAQGPKRAATAEQLKNGIPMFIHQLTRTLEAEQSNENATSLEISGPAGGDTSNLFEMGLSATAHGKALLHLGCTVDQVVHDYGDLCQAITDLACERDAPFNIDEYRRLNRCLDNVMADAVTKFSAQRDVALTAEQSLHENEQLGFLIHELLNVLGTASLAVRAMEMGSLTLAGATGSVLKRSLASMAKLISNALAEVGAKNKGVGHPQLLSLADLIAEAKTGADLDAATRGCLFTVAEVHPCLGIQVNHELMLAALMNLLHNAFKFTHRHTQVSLAAYAVGERILVDVKDHCGGTAAAGPALALGAAVFHGLRHGRLLGFGRTRRLGQWPPGLAALAAGRLSSSIVMP